MRQSIRQPVRRSACAACHAAGAGKFPRRGVARLAILGLLLTWGGFSAFGAQTAGAPPARLQAELERLSEDGGIAVGADGHAVLTIHPGRYIPASIIKLATALAALERLGADYRFRTHIYRDERDNLIIRGFGDPFLVSEEWRTIATALAAKGHFDLPLNDVVADGSVFASDLDVDGLGASINPYDARLGALVSNFNTVNLEVRADGTIRSAEPQTPLTPLALTLGRGLAAGVERINLSSRAEFGAQYSGELARAIFAEAGATIKGAVRTGAVPPGSVLILAHRSTRTLKEVVRAMMDFSNNFIANQILTVLHMESGGRPARLRGGTAILGEFLVSRIGLSPGDFHLVEGSGISRGNWIELAAMLKIVDAFHPWRGLLRYHGPPSLDVLAKTGTLTGVSSLAGFFPATEGSRRPFVIMLNQPRSVRERVFRLLAGFYADPAAHGNLSAGATAGE